MHIPSNIEELQTYKPGRDIRELAAELEIAHPIVLWNNENNLGFTPKVKEAILQAVDSVNRYPDPLSTKLSEAFALRCGRNSDEIVIGNGSEALLNNLFTAFFEPGDVLLTSEGTFVAVYVWAKAHNTRCELVPLNSRYAYDLDEILRRISPHTRLIYLATPNNPTGAAITSEALKNFILQVPSHILVVVDEAYSEYMLHIDPEMPDTAQWHFPNLITLRTFSKAYGIAGLRIGYAVAPPPLAQAMRKVKLTFEPGILQQVAAFAALQDSDFLSDALHQNQAALNMYYNACSTAKLQYVTSYGNFIMTVFSNSDEAERLNAYLMKNGIFTRHLKAFGLPHCVRITTGTLSESAQCAEVLSRFK
jgi:histidinol-phosphate aminotransferase